MTDLIHITIPFLGRLYAQRDTITLRRVECAVLHGPSGKEYLLCLGRLRVYLTPPRVIAAEASPERR
ncbi:hypothetical protein [Sediminimonas sp.]|uniref:hypothetical protein n=1 Tax=Sediminimonas sp. TaxID=2823379 RepID=UPI0025FDE596|nr:hypothetical protein [Sediminimonas sp.]